MRSIRRQPILIVKIGDIMVKQIGLIGLLVSICLSARLDSVGLSLGTLLSLLGSVWVFTKYNRLFDSLSVPWLRIFSAWTVSTLLFYALLICTPKETFEQIRVTAFWFLICHLFVWAAVLRLVEKGPVSRWNSELLWMGLRGAIILIFATFFEFAV